MVIEEQKVGILTYNIHIEDVHGELLEQASEDNPRTLYLAQAVCLKALKTN